MSRSKWKIPYAKQIYNISKESKNFSRSSIVFSQFIGSIFNTYNGKSNTEIAITEKMLNHKFGEFSLTRSTFVFKKNKKIKKHGTKG